MGTFRLILGSGVVQFTEIIKNGDKTCVEGSKHPVLFLWIYTILGVANDVYIGVTVQDGDDVRLTRL